MKSGIVLFTFLLCLLLNVATASAATLQDIRLAGYQPGVVRLVADLSDKTNASVFRLNNPSRLVIDFNKTTFGRNAPQKIPAADFIKNVRTGQPNAKTARLVLDLPSASLTEKHFLIPPSDGNKNWRFVMDLTGPSAAVSSSKPQENTAKPVSQKKNAVREPSRLSEITPPPRPDVGLTPIKKTKKVIVLDPGHGGQDPGAISRSGKYEKNITLAMAQETRELLEDAGYKVVLTRDKDKAIPLRGRTVIAHQADGDLFISIHADSAKDRNARGLSVYTISEKASDVEAAALAERENKADILLGLDLTGYNSDVSNLLIDLAKIDTMNQSALFAKSLVAEMKRETTLVPNAHRMAGFAVLKSMNTPAVLLELGYLSNRQEEKLLQKKSYRKELAKAVVRAVDAYFKGQD